MVEVGADHHQPETIAIEVLLCGPGEQEQMLRDGRGDVALLHRPFDSTAGLDVEDLTGQGQVAVLPAGHPLSRRTELTLADLAALEDPPSPRWPRSDGSYPDAPGPQVHNHEQLLQLIGLGRTTAVLPESVRGSLRGGHAVVPVLDAAVVTTMIAWPPQSTSMALAALVRTATRL